MTVTNGRMVRVGDATVTVKQTTVGGTAVVSLVVDCRHSTTQASVIAPDAAEQWSEQQIVALACRRALSETPCSCIERLMAQYEAGF